MSQALARPEAVLRSLMSNAPARRILVVDDDETLLETVADYLKLEGYEVATEVSAAAALARLDRHDIPDLALVDLKIKQASGLELMAQIRQRAVIPIIIITGYGTIETAVKAMQEGAADFVVKPFEPDILPVLISKTLRSEQLARENERLRAEIDDRFASRQILGEDAKIIRLRELITEVGPSQASVLITGETGTGKELVARAVHGAGPRGAGPFVAVNCSAIPEDLFESEFFGHEKGAFTGATAARVGRVEAASGGTLFLDEVGSMPLRLQAKLLRVLQEREFERVGSHVPRRVDFRVISATNLDLQEAIGRNEFRQDFYFRLRVVPLELPPLRGRPGDIPILAQHFLRRFARETRQHVRAFGPAALEQLTSYSWPGNVRELASVVERAVLLCRGELITDLQLQPSAPNTALPYVQAFRQFREVFERSYLEGLFAATRGNVSRAAKISGLSRRHLQRMRARMNPSEAALPGDSPEEEPPGE